METKDKNCFGYQSYNSLREKIKQVRNFSTRYFGYDVMNGVISALNSNFIIKSIIFVRNWDRQLKKCYGYRSYNSLGENIKKYEIF